LNGQSETLHAGGYNGARVWNHQAKETVPGREQSAPRYNQALTLDLDIQFRAGNESLFYRFKFIP